jgi:signal transduction histidine kinase
LSSAYTLISLIEKELEGTENETLKQYFALLQQINERTLNMINGVLEYSRTNFNNIKITEIDLNKICIEIVKEYSINKNVVIQFDTAMPKVQYNEFALTQILHNLVNNAVKYNDKPICQLAITCADKNGFYEISVTDNGPGIKDSDREKIFDLFENLKNEKINSHGVGLSIAKKLVTQANGSIWTEPAENQGARFTFTIEKRDAAYTNSLVE